VIGATGFSVRAGITFALGLVLMAFAPGAALAAGDPADFGVTLDGPSASSVGGRAVYAIEVGNAGPGNEAAKVRLTRGHGATSVEEGEPLHTFSQSTSQGTCFADKLGVICRVGQIAPGETAKIEVTVKVLTSDIPKIALQATVQPDLETVIDSNAANDHVELVTEVRAPITVDGFPDGCAPKPFTLKVAVDVPNAKQTKVIVDGKTVETSGKARFSVKLDPRDLDRGKHSLSIVVQAAKGPPVATLKRKFETC
jgi:hypothetical protein